MVVSGSQYRSNDRRFWCALTGVAIAVSLTGAQRAAAQFAVTSSNDVALTQVDYANDNGNDLSSNGEILINESQLATDAGANDGYMNIADSSGNWIVQNVPVIAGVPYLSVQLPLGTPDGTNETGNSEKFSIDMSANALTTFTPTTPTNFTVAGEEEDSNEGEGAAFTPGALAATAINFVANGLVRSTSELTVPNVQAADNQCGPAAIANALAWLQTNKGLNVPDPNVPGRGVMAGQLVDPGKPAGATYAANGVVVPNGPNSSIPKASPPLPAGPPYAAYVTNETPGKSLVGSLDLTMNRVSGQRADYFDGTTNKAGQLIDVNGDTTGTTQTIGVEQYLGAAGDAAVVSIDTQGNIAALTNGGITNNNLGASVTANFLYNEMSSGEAIKLGYTGHAVDVIATGSILTAPWVLLQSDLAQTSQGDPNDTLLNNYFPFGIASTLSIPQFSWFNQTAQTLPDLNVGVFNAIAISVVPEPGTLTLALGAAALCSLRRRRKQQV